MKFGKSLSTQIEDTLPEWRDKFLSYKELKKRLKLIEPKRGNDVIDRPNKRRRTESDVIDVGISKEEADFILLLEAELEKFNSFFVEKEEEYIIRLKILQERVAKAKNYNEEMIKIRKEIVDFHGEMVLLENYSALNYTGLVKILKKYDKRTGALIRLPFIQRVLQQPFFTTDLLYKLVKECESMLDSLFAAGPSNDRNGEPAAPNDGDREHDVDRNQSRTEPSTSAMTQEEGGPPEFEHMDCSYMKSTISALRILKEIRSGSSTVSVFSLPPLQLSGVENTWKKNPILEQVTKS
jgi:SPX domain protein involved in polyphosphate accumulation